MEHLGFVIDSNSQRISLSGRKATGLQDSIKTLAAVARVNSKVSALAVASVVGKLWSIHAVAHRATAIEARGNDSNSTKNSGCGRSAPMQIARSVALDIKTHLER